MKQWMRWIGLALCLSLTLAQGQAREAGPFSFATTPGKLPKHVIPLEYSLLLQPDWSQHSFVAETDIRVQVLQPVRQIVMNANELIIRSATLFDQHGAAHALTTRTNAKDETLTLILPRQIAAGNYRLFIAYRGKINRQPYGLFFDTYPTASGEKKMLATEFEPTEARRLLPCWDEPVFRARFQVAIDLPAHLKVFSNTAIASQGPAPDGKLQRTRFHQTPKMPSYLLVLAAGELERTQATFHGVDMGIVTTEGKQGGVAYPLQISGQLLGYFNDYFGLPYTLPKLDHIAVPNGYGGAMENWGGIIYNESVLLHDPRKDSPAAKRGVFGITAHEMAHQWFGNLVTMAWWDDLWLNEGFASWMASKASDHFHPGWHVWLDEHAGKEDAMEQDAQQNTHPVQQAVHNESEANDAFDGITYAKGQAFLRMLEQYLGEQSFQSGIRLYLGKHQYSNTTSVDLWNALQQASGKPVAELSQSWLQQSGFPQISVVQRCVDGQRQIELTQQRFLEPAREERSLWHIPMQLQFGFSRSETIIFKGQRMTLTRPGCDEALLLDPQALGFFRVNYAPAMFHQLQAGWRTLPDSLRLKLMADTWAQVRGGQLPLENYLLLVRQLDDEPRLAVWEQVFDVLNTLHQLGSGQSWFPAWQQHWHQLLAPRFAKLGWTEIAGETEEQRQLRARFIEVLSRLDQPGFVAEGQILFQRWSKNPASIAVSLQEPVLNLAARHASAETWKHISGMANTALGSNEKARYHTALSLVKDPKLAQQTLNLLLDPAMPGLTFNILLYGLAANGHMELAWQFVQKNHVALLAKQSIRDRYKLIPTILSNAIDLRFVSEMQAFVKTKQPPEALVETLNAVDAIRTHARRKGILLPQMKQVLQ